ncbi:MAG: CRISPR-associated endonuclease Cas1 [Candidatus Thioglobus sp.]
MIKRTIDISEQAYLHLKHQQLLIDKQGKTVGQVPIEDLGVLILQHPAIVISQQVIIHCQKNKVVIVFVMISICRIQPYFPLQKAIPYTIKF